MMGVVKELPVPRAVPPVALAYQFTVPEAAVAARLTVPMPQRLPGVVEESDGLLTVIVSTLEFTVVLWQLVFARK